VGEVLSHGAAMSSALYGEAHGRTPLDAVSVAGPHLHRLRVEGGFAVRGGLRDNTHAPCTDKYGHRTRSSPSVTDEVRGQDSDGGFEIFKAKHQGRSQDTRDTRGSGRPNAMRGLTVATDTGYIDAARTQGHRGEVC
jgi:hypothetical protein